jgi:hypothetical protein
MSRERLKHLVGEIRPSQILTTYGIGSIVDLPHLATLVMGLEDWNTDRAPEIGEERLLAAVRAQLGDQVERLRGTPMEPERDLTNPYDQLEPVGVPVATFPRWLVCPYCRLLAPLSSGLFKLKVDEFHSDRSCYVHDNCRKPGNKPNALPARFLVACPGGHLDDFPWVWYVHRGHTNCPARLRLREFGVSGEAADLNVECETCQMRRSMAEAFGQDNALEQLNCSGRWPHLREYAETACAERPRAILLGASNFWFPVSLSALAIPAETDRLGRLVEAHWVTLSKITSLDRLALLRELNQLIAFSTVPDAELWEAIERYRTEGPAASVEAPTNLRVPEWKAFSAPDPQRESKDFRLRQVAPPDTYARYIDKVVLVERLREVQALIGFTRIVSPGELSEQEDTPLANRAPIARRSPLWVPASEVRGEGIFMQFDEAALETWEARPAVREWTDEFFRGHVEFRRSRNIPQPGNFFPGLRYVLLHSFSHSLMRRLSIECGYTAASIAERVYSLPSTDINGPMAGVLIYTAAADSEGTLGGLVSLGEPTALGRLLDLALEEARLCSSDPLCAEHRPSQHSLTLHGAACHSCLFAPETACERGNKYLDRSLLVEPVFPAGRAFFESR